MIRSRLVVATFVLSLAFFGSPRTAEALVVHDAINWIQNNISAVQNTVTAGAVQGLNLKEYGLDPIAYALSQTVLNSMTQSVVNWVATGFNGSPAFVTDLQRNLLRLGDATANNYLAQLQADGRIDSPFRSSVLASARDTYYRNTGGGAFGAANPYTLNRTCARDTEFLAGTYFDLDCFVGAFRNPANNPFGSSLLTTDAVLRQVGVEEDERREELRQGNGFLSWRRCENEPAAPAAGEPIDLTQVDTTANCPIVNPGSAIYSAMTDVLGAPIARLTSADEINEIIVGLMSTLVNDLLNEGFAAISEQGRNARTPSAAESNANASLLGSLSASIANQKTVVTSYQNAWQVIQGAANAAQARLQSCTNSENAQTILAREVQPVVTQAAAALNKSVGALNGLNALQSRIQASTNQAADLPQIATDFQNMVRSRQLPDGEEVAYAITESQDLSAESTSTTLYRKMAIIANGSCNQSGNAN